VNRAWVARWALVAAAAVGLAAACSPAPEPTPVVRDGGHDAGPAAADAAQTPDAGAFPDAGEPPDAGASSDAGPEDAGPQDAGPTDAGCVTDAGDPPNLLYNPSFECGAPPEGWTAGTGVALAREESIVRSGEASARLSSATGGSVMAMFPVDFPAQMVGQRLFCAEAWALGPPGTTARLTIRATTAGAANDANFNAPMSGAWERLHVSLQTTAVHDRVTVRVAAPDPAPGAVLHVDDVALWESPDGGCTR
jgi:hypothetical protein